MKTRTEEEILNEQKIVQKKMQEANEIVRKCYRRLRELQEELIGSINSELGVSSWEDAL